MNIKQDNIALQNKSVFQRPVWVVIFALTAAMAWGWAYPLIKLGFLEFDIKPDMTGSKMFFAGIRFCLAGLVILLIAKITRRNFKVQKKHSWRFILVFSFLNTTIHYACFYFGLSHSEGSRAAILNSLGIFLLVLLACAFFPSDKLTKKKIAGCIIGFIGIMALNLGDGESGKFTFLGDGMIILNSISSAIAGLMIRALNKRIDIFVGTGYSLSIGGFMLLVFGYLMGGTLPKITPHGIVILFLLICISILGFTLFNKLLSCNPVGKVAIFNSLIPIVGVFSSCIFLDEQFYMKYIIAVTMATIGIYLVNKGE